MKDNKLMGSSVMIFCFLLLVLCATQIEAEADDFPPYLTCSEAASTMQPCMVFFQGWGLEEPHPICCLAGLRLTEMASTLEARKQVCQCFGENYPTINLHRVERLRHACVKNLPISTDPLQDCNNVLSS